jgi:DNA-directed RNA polymerase specialized sigma subunit
MNEDIDIAQHAGLVWDIAKLYRHTGIPKEDLVQFGMISTG